jgi:hypothetical protein
MLVDGTFEDKQGEAEGAGEKIKEEIQASISKSVERAELMKSILDSGEIPESTPEIQVDYTYKNPQTRKVERQESITLDLEKKLEEYISFYTKNNIDLPPTFEQDIKDIWERNNAGIQEAVEQNGFNDMIIAPANIKLPELVDKLKMENGFYTSSNFDSGGGFPGSISTGTDKPRIILVHKAKELNDIPELKQTKNKKAQDLKVDNSLSLDDYIIFQKKYFEETGKHLDENNYTWLLKTKSGSRFVNSVWTSSRGRLNVNAADADYSDSYLGSRDSRYFT